MQAKLPNGMTKEERDQKIFEKVHNGESCRQVAKEFGLSYPSITKIYRTKWKEYCSMPQSEKVIASIGKDRFCKIGPNVYEGHYTDKTGRSIKKRFEGEDAKEKWIAWREQLATPKVMFVPKKEEKVVETIPAVVQQPAPEPAELYILRSTEVTGEQVLFKDLDKALYISEMMTRITGVKTEVVEYTEPVFWKGEA